ncbi:MAG: 4-hydroxy-tetrahydrodipicolinate synthase [Alphaproteobacteria bacterium]|nr:4-hydroxy-tetrahydrodipicolinate synthase [Alphaproteobacteria bacterium]
MFQGVYTALITPMLPDGALDESSLKNLLERQIAGGVHGIVSMGTTGESATFPDADHLDIVAKTIDYVAGRVPVIAGCGSNDTVHLVHLAKELEKIGASALMAVTPYYNKPNGEGLYQHYARLAEAVSTDIILYNVPPRTGINMSVDVVARLAKDFKHIVALKDAVPGEITRVLDVHLAAGNDFSVLSGEDVTTVAGYILGMKGTISVTANVAPRLMVECYNAFQAGNRDELLRLCRILHPLHQGLFTEPNPIIPKAALQLMGVIKHDSLRLPLVSASDAGKQQLRQLLQSLGLL